MPEEQRICFGCNRGCTPGRDHAAWCVSYRTLEGITLDEHWQHRGYPSHVDMLKEKIEEKGGHNMKWTKGLVPNDKQDWPVIVRFAAGNGFSDSNRYLVFNKGVRETTYERNNGVTHWMAIEEPFDIAPIYLDKQAFVTTSHVEDEILADRVNTLSESVKSLMDIVNVLIKKTATIQEKLGL